MRSRVRVARAWNDSTYSSADWRKGTGGVRVRPRTRNSPRCSSTATRSKPEDHSLTVLWRLSSSTTARPNAASPPQEGVPTSTMASEPFGVSAS